MAYFNNFPKIYYNNHVARNLVLKAQFYKQALGKLNLFYPYTIKHDERADMIAHSYYGSSDYTWLVYFSNEMLDPYFEWPLTVRDFEAYLIKKYGDLITPLNTISHYEYDTTQDNADPERDYSVNYRMTPDTWNALSVEEKGYWNPIYVYDEEFNKNEAKRNIQLFDNDLLFRVEKEIGEIFR